MKKTFHPQVNRVYLTDEQWAYNGCYTKIGDLKGLDRGEKLWTMLGALLLELKNTSELSVVIYNDSRLVDEWNGEVSFISPISRGIACKIKNGLSKFFLTLEIKKLDRHAIESEIKKNQLV